MSTFAFDVATVGRALDELAHSYLGDSTWVATNQQQEQLFAWYNARREDIAKLSGLESLAATDYLVLNSFLEARGFQPQFRPFDGVGVASVLDMLVEWLLEGTTATVSRWENRPDARRYGRKTTYPAFRLTQGVDIFEMLGRREPLVRIATKTGHHLWLTKSRKPSSGVDLAMYAQQVLSTRRLPNLVWPSVTIPMLEIDSSPDLNWLCGANTLSERDGYHEIRQAFQHFKLRANAKGARVVASTGIATSRAVGPAGPRSYEFDDPFVGFFTQPDSRIAVAAFWADTDSWRNSEGTLEGL